MLYSLRRRIIGKLRVERFSRRLNRQLKAYGVDSKEIKEQKSKYKEKIRHYLLKFDYFYEEMRVFIAHVKSYEEAFNHMKVAIEAINQGLDEYVDFRTISKVVLKGQDPNFYLQLAKDFKNYNLEDDNQGNFHKLRSLVKISLNDIAKIVEVMIYTKNAGCPLNQKQIVKYYDSFRPQSEDLESLKNAWIFAYEHDFEITIADLIQAIKYGRKPLNFVINFNKILTNDLPIPYDKFKIFDISQQKITELITLMIKARLADIYLDFETIYDDLKLKRDVWENIRYLIKFFDSDITEIDYDKVRNYSVFGGNLRYLHIAFLYNNKYNVIENKTLYDSALEILLVKSKDLNFNALLFAKALQMADEHNVTQNEVINDYLGGYDVYNILNYMGFAKKYDVLLTYKNAKIIDRICKKEDNKNCVKEVIDMALNPLLLEGESFLVTTKDNIEIKAKMFIEAVLQIENYFKGSDEKMLFQRASAIFIDEIQRKYNHDEIIINIEKISNNVLDRLKKETRNQVTDYFETQDMIRIKKKLHHSHKNKDNKEQNQEHSQNKHIEEDNYQNKLHSEYLKLPQQSKNEKEKFINTSKYMPLKVLIPKIEFVKDTFKDFEKAKEKFLLEKHKHEAEIKKIEAEIELKKAWAKSKDLKYLILKDDEEDNSHGHSKKGH